MRPDKKNTEHKREKNEEIRLHKPLHPDSKQGGKGAQASREFHENCEFNVNGKK